MSIKGVQSLQLTFRKKWVGLQGNQLDGQREDEVSYRFIVWDAMAE